MSTTTPLTTLPQAAADYLTAVTEALGGLPDGEREDLVEEVAAHLADVAAELGSELDAASLRVRLGSPETYAAELLGAAGYDSEPTPRVGRVARWRKAAHGMWTVAVDLPGAEGARRLAVELRPGWWVLRAWALLTWISLSNPGEPINVIPHVVNNSLVSFGLLVAAIGCSVWLGRWVLVPGRAVGWRFAAVVINVVLVVGCVPIYNGIQSRAVLSFAGDGSFAAAAAPTADVPGTDGSGATNLFAFTPDGKPIPRFYLYDENGQPVDIGTDSYCADESTSTLPFDNAYPREQYTQRTDAYGNVTKDCVPAGTAPGFGVTIPSSSAAPAASAAVSKAQVSPGG